MKQKELLLNKVRLRNNEKSLYVITLNVLLKSFRIDRREGSVQGRTDWSGRMEADGEHEYKGINMKATRLSAGFLSVNSHKQNKD